MEKHHEFTEWAIARGVKINGIAAHRFPGRGLGIIAETRHEAGSTLLTVPMTIIRTAATVPKSISKSIGPISVHGLLAADLAMDNSATTAPWRAVMPTRQDFKESMPLMWDPNLQALLPLTSKTLLENQKRKLSKDWASTYKCFPDLVYEDYLYHWLVVNTRTFHYTSSSRQSKKPSNPDDCMALNPFADYFNHTDSQGCEVSFGPDGYKIHTAHTIEQGDEIYISYGSHSNDFLLAEYGFILSENKWDETSLDSCILPLFSKQQKQQLDEVGFLGKYTLDKETTCHRTQVALRLLCLSGKRWQRFVGGQDDGEKEQPAVDACLAQILDGYLDHVEEKMERLTMLDSGLDSQRTALSNRWKQIHYLLKSTIERIRS